MRVTPQTQSRFEELYYDLTQRYTEYTISAMIAEMLHKTIMSIYMYFRQCFGGGSEAKKRQLIEAMELILEERS